MTTTLMNVAAKSVTGRSDAGRRPTAPVNVGETERWLSVLGGSALAVWGFSGRGLVNQVVLPIVGGMLVYRGLSGHCACYSAMGIDTSADTGPATSVEA